MWSRQTLIRRAKAWSWVLLAGSLISLVVLWFIWMAVRSGATLPSLVGVGEIGLGLLKGFAIAVVLLAGVIVTALTCAYIQEKVQASWRELRSPPLPVNPEGRGPARHIPARHYRGVRAWLRPTPDSPEMVPLPEEGGEVTVRLIPQRGLNFMATVEHRLKRYKSKKKISRVQDGRLVAKRAKGRPDDS